MQIAITLAAVGGLLLFGGAVLSQDGKNAGLKRLGKLTLAVGIALIALAPLSLIAQ